MLSLDDRDLGSITRGVGLADDHRQSTAEDPGAYQRSWCGVEDQVGQVLQGVVEVVPLERREREVLSHWGRDRRPVVGERHPGL